MPLIPFTLAWLIGIWIASRLALPTVALGFAIGVVIASIILTWRVPKPRWIFVLALAAILGALRFDPAQPDLDQTSLATYNDQQKLVIAEGVVVGEPDARDKYTNLRVEADRLAITNQPTKTVKGMVLAHDQGFAPLGWLAPFTGCAFKAHATLTRVIAQTLRVPEPQASLLTGILLGDDAGIPKSVQAAFRTTGTGHLELDIECSSAPR